MTNKQDIFGTMNEFYTFIEDMWMKFTTFNKEIIEEFNSCSKSNKPRWYKIETAKEEVISIIDIAFKRYNS